MHDLRAGGHRRGRRRLWPGPSPQAYRPSIVRCPQMRHAHCPIRAPDQATARRAWRGPSTCGVTVFVTVAVVDSLVGWGACSVLGAVGRPDRLRGMSLREDHHVRRARPA